MGTLFIYTQKNAIYLIINYYYWIETKEFWNVKDLAELSHYQHPKFPGKPKRRNKENSNWSEMVIDFF